MSDEKVQNQTDGLIARADGYVNERKFSDAAKLYEQAAAQSDDKEEKAAILKKAARAYGESRKSEAAVRCYLDAGNLMGKNRKAECLMACWSVYIRSIAGYAWDCSYEWRGDEDHDDDHEMYQTLIKEARDKAADILKQALNVQGADRKKIIKMALQECKERKKQGGWGEGACWEMVADVTGEKKRSLLDRLKHWTS